MARLCALLLANVGPICEAIKIALQRGMARVGEMHPERRLAVSNKLSSSAGEPTMARKFPEGWVLPSLSRVTADAKRLLPSAQGI